VETLFAFNEADKNRILQQLDGGIQARNPSMDSNDPWTLIGVVATGGITARAGTTPGTGTINVYHVNDSGTLAHYNSQAITVYNLSSAAIVAGKYVMCKRDYVSWKWFVDFEDC
jgi:sorbitol-specific phosphotransferase system component IIBC